MHATSTVPARAARRFQVPLIALTFILAAAMGMPSSSTPAFAADPATHPGLDLSTPKKAALAFAKGLVDGNMETVKQTATGSVKEFAIVKSLGDMLQAMKRYETAAVKKFGEDGKMSKEDSKDLVAEVEAADEKIEGEKATLVNKAVPNEKNPMTLRKTGNDWKVDLSTLSNDKESERILDLSKSVVEALDGAAKDVEAGKFKTAKDAKSAMETAMLTTMMKSPGEK